MVVSFYLFIGFPPFLTFPTLDRNTFSLHVWWHDNANAAAEFAQAVNAVVAQEIPFIVEEFAGVCQNCDTLNNDSPYADILTLCQQHAIDWIAWEWGPSNEYGDPPCFDMNMITGRTYANLKAGWAKSVAIDHPYSIQNTAVTPYFFDHPQCEGD